MSTNNDLTASIAQALPIWRDNPGELAAETGLSDEVIAHAIASGDPAALLASDDLMLRFHGALRARVWTAKRMATVASAASDAVLRHFVAAP